MRFLKSLCLAFFSFPRRPSDSFTVSRVATIHSLVLPRSVALDGGSRPPARSAVGGHLGGCRLLTTLNKASVNLREPACARLSMTMCAGFFFFFKTHAQGRSCRVPEQTRGPRLEAASPSPWRGQGSAPQPRGAGALQGLHVSCGTWPVSFMITVRSGGRDAAWHCGQTQTRQALGTRPLPGRPAPGPPAGVGDLRPCASRLAAGPVGTSRWPAESSPGL